MTVTEKDEIAGENWDKVSYKDVSTPSKAWIAGGKYQKHRNLCVGIFWSNFKSGVRTQLAERYQFLVGFDLADLEWFHKSETSECFAFILTCSNHPSLGAKSHTLCEVDVRSVTGTGLRRMWGRIREGDSLEEKMIRPARWSFNFSERTSPTPSELNSRVRQAQSKSLISF